MSSACATSETGSGASTSGSSRWSQAGRLGPVLWQLPENFHRDDERLRGMARGAAGWAAHDRVSASRAGLRPRCWRRCAAHGVALTIGDHPKRPFQSQEATADWRFVRFHYGSRGRDGNYSATELEAWARRITAWRRADEVYAYFNNDWQGFAPANARSLIALPVSLRRAAGGRRLASPGARRSRATGRRPAEAVGDRAHVQRSALVVASESSSQ